MVSATNSVTGYAQTLSETMPRQSPKGLRSALVRPSPPADVQSPNPPQQRPVRATPSAGHRGNRCGVKTSTAGRLCVLGAGNANDLDLPILAGAFEQIHLADLDPEALRQAIERHPELDSCHPAAQRLVDLSGIAAQLDNLDHPPRSRTTIRRTHHSRSRRHPRRNLPEAFDVVASTCLLSQLMNAAVAAVGESEPRLLELLAAIRIGHLRLLANVVAPGGTGLLFTDIASSDDTPAIAAASDPALNSPSRPDSTTQALRGHRPTTDRRRPPP